MDEPTIDDKIRTAYAVALTAQHQSCRVQIHVGSAVLEHLKALCTEKIEGWRPPTEPTMWGFPLIPDETLEPEDIAVHSVQRILS
jgi:hypothetical protein